MDAWIEEEIAQELEKIGIDDIETVEEGEYCETSPFTLVDTTEICFDFQKYQSIQASYWEDFEDIFDETKAITTVQTDNGSNGRTTPVQANNVWPNHVNESLLPSEDENASLKVLCESREQQQIERNDILKEIEKKKDEIELLAAKRRIFLAKVEEEKLKQEKDHFKRMESSCIVLQSYWRGYRTRKVLLKVKNEIIKTRKETAVIIIQQNWRKYYKKKNICSRKIQQYWRHYRHRTMINAVLSVVRQTIKENEIATMSTVTDNGLIETELTIDKEVSLEDNIQVVTNGIERTMSHTVETDLQLPTLKNEEQHSPEPDTTGNILLPDINSIAKTQTVIVSPAEVMESLECNNNNPSVSCLESIVDTPIVEFKGHVSNEHMKPSAQSVHTNVVTFTLDTKPVNQTSPDTNDHYTCMPLDKTILYEENNENGGLHGVNETSLIAHSHNSSLPNVSPHIITDTYTSNVDNKKEDNSYQFCPPLLAEPVVLSCSKSEVQFGSKSSSSSVWGNVTVSKKQKALSGLKSESGTKHTSPLKTSSVTSSYCDTSSKCVNVETEQNKANHNIQNIHNNNNTSHTNDKYSSVSLPSNSKPIDKLNNDKTSSDNRYQLSVSSPCLDSTPSRDVAITELQDMIALKESRTREEGTAQLSRVRMNQLFSAEQISDMAVTVRKADTYSSRVEYAATPLSPNAWVGLIQERLKSWQETRIHSTNKLSSSSHRFTSRSRNTPTPSSGCVPLSRIQILSASPEGTAIEEVTFVHVYHSRSQIDLASLSQCSALCSLFLAKCQLTSFHGFRETKSTLKDITLTCNAIDTMDFTHTPNLVFLDLSENRLPSIHGLDNCSELLELCLDDNRITRIGGLFKCSKLQKLSIDSNLIIDSLGISCLPELQYLSIGENHLPSLIDIQQCTVLQCLLIQQNNLQMCPSFTNNCLLRELVISENCLSDITLLEQSWLPLLQTLNIANNCISAIHSLVGCIMLNSLHIQHNNIYDLASFLQSIRGCYELHELFTTGNPFEEEPKYRKMLLKAVPHLKKLNGEDIHVVTLKKMPINPPQLIADNPIYKMCSRQIKEQNDMKNRHQKTIQEIDACSSVINNPEIFSSLLNTKINNCQEYSDLLQCHLKEQATFDGICHIPLYERLKIRRNNSAVVIQSRWRSYKARNAYTHMRLSAILIQSWWRRLKGTQESQSCNDSSIKNKAAIIIQAHLKGYIVRKKLQRILSQINDNGIEEEEIEILFDESILSDDSMRPLTPNDDIFDRYLSLYHNTDTSTPAHESVANTSDHLISVPKFTLPGAIEEELIIDNGGKVGVLDNKEKRFDHTSSKGVVGLSPLPPSNNKQDMADTTSWMFTSNVTADLMRRKTNRHRKLHRAATQRTKLHDPIERLALFKRTSSHNVDKQINTTHDKEPMKFQWAHERKIVHSDVLPRTTNVHNHLVSTTTGQAKFLPDLQPHVLAGHAPRLVTSSVQNDLVRKQTIGGSPNKLKPTRSSVYNAWN